MAVLGSDNISHSGDFKINVNSADRVTITTTGKIQASAGTNWVGTVSENGTSAIIEQGSNANGIYTKFADGTMLCGRTIGANDGASSGTWTFPVAFSAAPHISNSGCRTIEGGVGEGIGVIVPNGVFPVNTTRYNWTHFRLSGFGNSARFFAQRAYGRWY